MWSSCYLFVLFSLHIAFFKALLQDCTEIGRKLLTLLIHYIESVINANKLLFLSVFCLFFAGVFILIFKIYNFLKDFICNKQKSSITIDKISKIKSSKKLMILSNDHYIELTGYNFVIMVHIRQKIVVFWVTWPHKDSGSDHTGSILPFTGWPVSHFFLLFLLFPTFYPPPMK